MDALIPVLNEDITRISQLGYYDAYTAEEEDGLKLLRTFSTGCCVYFDKAAMKCKIYDYRPELCKIKPVTITKETQEPTRDSQCRYSSDLELTDELIRRMKKIFKTIKKEVKWRRETGYF
jgi:Fe-S-cluster containining protein